MARDANPGRGPVRSGVEILHGPRAVHLGAVLGDGVRRIVGYVRDRVASFARGDEAGEAIEPHLRRRGPGRVPDAAQLREAAAGQARTRAAVHARGGGDVRVRKRRPLRRPELPREDLERERRVPTEPDQDVHRRTRRVRPILGRELARVQAGAQALVPGPRAEGRQQTSAAGGHRGRTSRLGQRENEREGLRRVSRPAPRRARDRHGGDRRALTRRGRRFSGRAPALLRQLRRSIRDAPGRGARARTSGGSGYSGRFREETAHSAGPRERAHARRVRHRRGRHPAGAGANETVAGGGGGANAIGAKAGEADAGGAIDVDGRQRRGRGVEHPRGGVQCTGARDDDAPVPQIADDLRQGPGEDGGAKLGGELPSVLVAVRGGRRRGGVPGRASPPAVHEGDVDDQGRRGCVRSAAGEGERCRAESL